MRQGELCLQTVDPLLGFLSNLSPFDSNLHEKYQLSKIFMFTGYQKDAGLRVYVLYKFFAGRQGQ